MYKRTKVSAVIAAAVLVLAGCNSKSVVKDLTKVTLEDIEKANKGDQLLENHQSISYKMELREEGAKMTEEAVLTKKDGEYCYASRLEDSEVYKNEVFKDGYMYASYGSGSGVEYAIYWFMDGEYDKYLKNNVDGFLVNTTERLKITKREVEEDFVSVTAQVDETDNVSEEYDFFYEYVMDKETLNVNQFVAYALDQEESKEILSFAQVTYDEEYKEPSYINRLEKKENKRSIKIIVDPGKDSEKKYTEEVAGEALFELVTADGYEVYTDKNGGRKYDSSSLQLDENGKYPDITLYVIQK